MSYKKLFEKFRFANTHVDPIVLGGKSESNMGEFYKPLGNAKPARNQKDFHIETTGTSRVTK